MSAGIAGSSIALASLSSVGEVPRNCKRDATICAHWRFRLLLFASNSRVWTTLDLDLPSLLQVLVAHLGESSERTI